MARYTPEEYDSYVETMKRRTKQFAIRTIRLVKTLNGDDIGRIISRQLLRSGTGVGANYRAACRVRTDKELAAKLRIVLEEADESQYWLEILGDAEVVGRARLAPLLHEAGELTAVFTRALNTVDQRRRKK